MTKRTNPGSPIRKCQIAFLVLLIAAAALPAQSWQRGPGYQFEPLRVPSGGKPGFSLMSATQTGIWFTNYLPESRSLTNTILPNGSGVAAGDVDEDGWCDLFFCGLAGGSRLYRNLGEWKFQDITDQSGVTCFNLDVTGAVFADVNGDGHIDLLINSIGGGTHIFLNNGKGHFTPTEQILNAGHGGTSLALADCRGLGWLDLYIANYRTSTILDAPGTRFSLKMINNRPEVVAINGQPLTDPEWTNRFHFKTEMTEGRGRFAREELGEADLFCLNNGRGHFDPVSWTNGAFLDEDGKPLEAPPFDWGLSVIFRDFNGDSAPDLYICNDFLTPDRFWLNDGHGHFRAAARVAIRDTSFSSMGIDVADLNRDGFDDFMVVDMLSRDHWRRLTQRSSMQPDVASLGEISKRPQVPRNTLFLSRGDGTYAEIAQYAGLDASEWSWAPLFLDVDLDGFEDVLIPNGFVRDIMNMEIQSRIKQMTAAKRMLSTEELGLRSMFPQLATANLAFRNQGDLRFEEISREWGFDTTTISQGACLADLDNDGDLDVIVNNLNDAAGLYRNNCSARRLAVRLNGLPPNTRGIGARISVFGGPAIQTQEMVCGGRYLSGDDTVRMFAAGSADRLRIEVTWRNGKRSIVADARPDCLYEIEEAGASAVTETAGQPLQPFFEDVSQRLAHVHHEDPFDDFANQPLLPKRFSQLGPGVCWWDLDGDGWDELIIASGKGGQLACYHNNGDGGFKLLKEPPWSATANRDHTTVLGWNSGAVLVGCANYEDGLLSGSSVQLYQLVQARGANAGRRALDSSHDANNSPSPLPEERAGARRPSTSADHPQDLLPADDSSVGPLAVADYDGDGSLDLFVGGRVKPGKYPIAASSRIYRQQGGKLYLDEQNTVRLREVGLVSGAVWSDLDGDGWPELILACEWGPVRVFSNDHGVLKESTQALGLADVTGWWNSVTTGDFDGDGRPDIVAGNWGLNTKYERYRSRPLRLYCGDFSGDGSLQLLEVGFEPALRQYMPIRRLDSITKGIPSLIESFPSHDSWAHANLDQVIAALPQPARFVEANWLETTVFLNRNGHFEPHVLPMEAQFAPAFGVCVADYDGDGNEDIFLDQNFFDVEHDTSRYDAGRGLWLHGDGKGDFHTVPGQESGVKIYGEQRGAAVGDFDADGRVDLVVAQNNAETKLYHNLLGKPGLRVRLEGPQGNAAGVGAAVRLKFGDRFGPLREIHSGSGYWSQDSPVLVLATPNKPTEVWVRWPGGHTTLSAVPTGAHELSVNSHGIVRQIR